MMHWACIECTINERHSTRGGGTRVSAACASISLRACARYDARGLERVRETNIYIQTRAREMENHPIWR